MTFNVDKACGTKAERYIRIEDVPTDSKYIRKRSYAEQEKICATASHKFETDPEILISRLSFSHIVEIMKLDDPLERITSSGMRIWDS